MVGERHLQIKTVGIIHYFGVAVFLIYQYVGGLKDKAYGNAERVKVCACESHSITL